MLMATRPVEPGMVRLTNLIADSRATHGPSGSGASTAPRNDSASVMNVSWARTTPTATQAKSALLSSSTIVPNPIWASCLMIR